MSLEVSGVFPELSQGPRRPVMVPEKRERFFVEVFAFCLTFLMLDEFFWILPETWNCRSPFGPVMAQAVPSGTRCSPVYAFLLLLRLTTTLWLVWRAAPVWSGPVRSGPVG